MNGRCQAPARDCATVPDPLRGSEHTSVVREDGGRGVPAPHVRRVNQGETAATIKMRRGAPAWSGGGIARPEFQANPFQMVEFPPEFQTDKGD